MDLVMANINWWHHPKQIIIRCIMLTRSSKLPDDSGCVFPLIITPVRWWEQGLAWSWQGEAEGIPVVYSIDLYSCTACQKTFSFRNNDNNNNNKEAFEVSSYDDSGLFFSSQLLTDLSSYSEITNKGNITVYLQSVHSVWNLWAFICIILDLSHRVSQRKQRQR